MSWVLQEGPYHTTCSPLAEDAAYKQTAMIPLDKAATSLEEAPLPPIKISMRRRVQTVLSALWLLLSLVFALNAGNGDSVDRFSIFCIFGVAPVGLLWGLVWIYGAKRSRVRA